MCGEALLGCGSIQNGDIGYEKIPGADLNSQLGPHANLPFRGVRGKPGADGKLQCRVIVLAHGSLVDFTVDVIRVWAEVGMKVDLEGYVGYGSHLLLAYPRYYARFY